VRNQLGFFFRDAVSLKREPGDGRKRNQRHTEGKIRFVFETQRIGLTFSPGSGIVLVAI
jgi:hypothetical protein